jgi:hypothetical protein
MIAVNVGSIIATLVITLIPNDSLYYFTDYLVVASMFFVAALLFIIGSRYYTTL